MITAKQVRESKAFKLIMIDIELAISNFSNIMCIVHVDKIYDVTPEDVAQTLRLDGFDAICNNLFVMVTIIGDEYR